jgi:hypothetical protein
MTRKGNQDILREEDEDSEFTPLTGRNSANFED